MPIYEYTCSNCGHAFEKLVRASTVPDCPSCHGTELEKKLSVFATGKAQPEAVPAPCGACGHPGGPGACALS